ncbi:MAG: hypothetical protein ABI333_09215 [bacterium]
MFSRNPVGWRHWLSLVTLIAVVVTLGIATGCTPGPEGPENLLPRTVCTADRPCPAAPARGGAILVARTTYDDYQGATLSIEHAVVADEGEVRNDWDLLFGNDQDPELDLFTVNMVTDDRSFIVDLGIVDLRELPETVDPDDFPTGVFGEHDDLPVHVGHVYVIRTVDSDTVQYAVVKVLAHELNHSVQLDWYRSWEPNRLVLRRPDQP